VIQKNEAQSDSIRLNTKFNKSTSLNIMAGVFAPVYFDEKYHTGAELLAGLQFNTSELISLCLDFDFIFSKANTGNYSWEVIKKKYIVRLEFGPKFHIYKYKNLGLFAAPELGIMLIIDEHSKDPESLLPVCFSLETGCAYKLSNRISLVSKIKYNSYIAAGATKGYIYTFFLISSGINIRL